MFLTSRWRIHRDAWDRTPQRCRALGTTALGSGSHGGDPPGSCVSRSGAGTGRITWFSAGFIRVRCRGGVRVEQGWAELGEAISAIRAGIEQALVDGASSAVGFELGPVELELAATVHKDAEGSVKVALLPWSASAKGTVSADHTQRIKLTLQPIEPDAGGGAEPRRKRISDIDD